MSLLNLHILENSNILDCIRLQGRGVLMAQIKTTLKAQLFLLLSMLSLPLFAQQAALETSKAATVTMPREYRLDAVIEASRQATLSAQVSGRIESINFDVDDQVNKGDVIVRIRDTEYRARLQKASATLAEAQAGLDDANKEFKRVEGLYKDKVISKAGFDRASANLESAQARVAASRASVNEAQEQLENTVIRAPYSGIVIERHVEMGETTYIGQPIMSGYAIGELRINANVPQSIISAVREHRQATVLNDENQPSIKLSKLTVFPFADPTNHSFKVRLNLPDTASHLFPGMLVKVAFVTGDIQRLMIPASALVQRSEVVGVYLVDPQQQVSFRQVRTGASNRDQIEIIAGLDAGESVALDPVTAGIRLKAQWDAAK